MKKIKILITGGPVHAHLDSVKIITNRFKGGRMAQLADVIKRIDRDKIEITYITSKGSHIPDTRHGIEIVYHSGFSDYMDKVLKLAPKHDGVILGAAVCNLIPLNPLTGKFPSHNYKVGDVIPIEFTISPRIIDEVKKVAPKTKLFGFKLLQGVAHEELINAAYDIVLESRAVAVFANDANNLNTKYAVTKEKGVIEFETVSVSGQDKMAFFIVKLIKDNYYSTIETHSDFNLSDCHYAKQIMRTLIKENAHLLNKTYGEKKYKFGTIAVRVGNSNSFVTTARGKKSLDEFVIVNKVDNKSRKVYTSQKATLNAPLLYRLLSNRRDIEAIIHYHDKKDGCTTFPYSVPGTIRDTLVADAIHSCDEFYIDGHGTFELLNQNKVKQVIKEQK